MFQDRKIGILGGGQLGAMFLQNAISYGCNIAVLESSKEASCAGLTNQFVLGDTLNYEDVMSFGKELDIITIEKEAVNIDALKDLQRKGVKIYPQPEIIENIQDKYLQKQMLLAFGIPVAKGIFIENRQALEAHKAALPFCLKKCRSGYDGNGVMVLHTEADLALAFDEPSVLEELVAIEKEIAVIVARSQSGEITTFDAVEMVFDSKRFILDYQLCPANISSDIEKKAHELAHIIAEKMQLVGILAVEMFITQEGKLLVNEMAPRPHNSGHHSIEACATSQYDQLLRAITGLPLGETKIIHSSVMINVLQPHADKVEQLQPALQKVLQIPEAHLHWYGKKGHKEGRKMGHITVVGAGIEQTVASAEKIRNIINL